MITLLSLDSFVQDRLQDLKCDHKETKAYIINVLNSTLTKNLNDLSQSVVLIAAKASSFQDHQSLADSVLWTLIVTPTYHEKHRSLVCKLASNSYVKCGDILRGKWPLYYELAHNLNQITAEAHKMLIVQVGKP